MRRTYTWCIFVCVGEGEVGGVGRECDKCMKEIKKKGEEDLVFIQN